MNEEDGELESYLLDLDFRYVRQHVNQIWYKSIGVNILFTDQNVWSSFLSSVLWYDAKNTSNCDVTFECTYAIYIELLLMQQVVIILSLHVYDSHIYLLNIIYTKHRLG